MPWSAQRRSSRSTRSGRQGAAQVVTPAASGMHIHSGTWASVPSRCCTTNIALPRKLCRRYTDTLSPQRG
jgi:hypothetical protein